MSSAVHATVLFESTASFWKESDLFLLQLKRLLPACDFVLWRKGTANDEAFNRRDDIEFAVVWNMPASELAQMPKLRVVLMQGAGIDGIKPIDLLPKHIPIVRLVDPVVMQDIAAFVLHWILHYHLFMDVCGKQQARKEWLAPPHFVPRSEYNVAVLGFGNVGQVVCQSAHSMGYRVSAWCRSKRHHSFVHMFASNEYEQFLAGANVLVNTLPLTAHTDNIIDAKSFRTIKRGAVFINVGRGGTVDTDALLDALDAGHLRASVLDCFKQEPLPPTSRLWSNPRVIITPHCAGNVFARSSAKHIAENIERVLLGEEPFPIVNKDAGY